MGPNPHQSKSCDRGLYRAFCARTERMGFEPKPSEKNPKSARILVRGQLPCVPIPAGNPAGFLFITPRPPLKSSLKPLIQAQKDPIQPGKRFPPRWSGIQPTGLPDIHSRPCRVPFGPATNRSLLYIAPPLRRDSPVRIRPDSPIR